MSIGLRMVYIKDQTARSVQSDLDLCHSQKLSRATLSVTALKVIVFHRGLVVKCLKRNPGVFGSSRTGSAFFFSFFRGNVLGQDTSEPQPSTCEIQERHE